MYKPFKYALLSTGFAILSGLASLPAQAHNTWLLPSSTVLSSPQFVTFDAAVSEDFFYFTHRPLAIDTLTITAPDGHNLVPANVVKGELRTAFDVKLEKNGTYTLDIPRSGLRASWKVDGKPKRFMGNAEAFAKEVPVAAQDLEVGESVSHIVTFVTVGAPTAVKLTNHGLELVPVTHPNDLIAGEPAEFQFMVDGKPAPDIKVEVVSGQSHYRNALGETKYTSDKQGKVKITWPQPGMYFLYAVHKDNKVSAKQAKERSLSYSVTLEVQVQ